MAILSNSQQKLDRHRAFWMREDVDRAQLGVFRRPRAHDHQMWRSLKNRQIQPEDLHVKEILSYYEQIFDQYGLWEGDLLWFAEPLQPMAWLEAIMGCPLYWSGKSMWAKPRFRW